MGWRPGRGIGTATATKGCEAAGSKWGTVSGVSLDNTPLYVLLPKVSEGERREGGEGGGGGEGRRERGGRAAGSKCRG